MRLSYRIALLLLSCHLAPVPGRTDGQPPDGRIEPHAGESLVVRLTAPISQRGPDGSFALETGFPELDALMLETGIHRIESALPVSTHRPRDPEGLRRYGLDRTYRFYVPEAADVLSLVAAFSRLPGVEYAEPEYLGGIAGTFPDDPRFPDQWSLDQASDADVDAPEAWDIARGQGVVIAILDTGIDSDHEDLMGMGKLLPGYDFFHGDPDPEDDHGHGTTVASIASAHTNNGLGIAGTCWNCQLLPLKVWNQNGVGTPAVSADAMVWAADHGARVINYSGGYSVGTQTLLDGVRYAYDAGVTLISITANENLNHVYFPGAYAETIAVGATDRSDRRAVPFCLDSSPGSNYGPEIDVVAPGDEIDAATIGGYGFWCGTSFAAPLVSGLVGILETIDPSLGREEARHLVRSGAEDQVGDGEDTPGFDIYYGWGRVNMDRTLQAARSSVTLRVEGAASTRLYLEVANPLAASYDFVRGDLSALSESPAGVSVGTVTCIENDSPDPDTVGNEDSGTPGVGEGFFYLSRFNAVPGAGSYGGSSLNRDRFAAVGDCPE